MYFTSTLFSLNDITTDLFIKEFLLVTRLPGGHLAGAATVFPSPAPRAQLQVLVLGAGAAVRALLRPGIVGCWFYRGGVLVFGGPAVGGSVLVGAHGMQIGRFGCSDSLLTRA